MELEFFNKKLNFKISDTKYIPIDLNFFGLKICQYNSLKHRVEGSEEIFLIGDELAHSLELEIKHTPKIGKFNKKTKVYEVVTKQSLFEINFTFFKKSIYATKISSSSKRKDLADIYLSQRFQRFNYLGDVYTVNRVQYHAFGEISKKPFALLAFIKPQKDESLIKDPILCYDIETCVFGGDDSGVRNMHQPYLLAWSFTTNHSFLESDTEKGHLEHLNIKTRESTIGAQFVDLVERLLRQYEIESMIIFGYNNFNFDDNFVLDQFRNKDYFIVKSERNGKVSECDAYKGNVCIQFKDLIKWLPDVTLKEACIDYDTIVKKGECNVVTYNNYCRMQGELIFECDAELFFEVAQVQRQVMAQKRLRKDYYCLFTGKWLIFKYVLDYCILDVEATMGLFFQINATFLKVKKYFYEHAKCILPHNNVLRYISPAYCTSLLYKQMFKFKKMKRIVFHDLNYVAAVTSTYFGGIVNFGCLGEYTSENIVCQDVKAMYPTCMQSFYPAIYTRKDVQVGGEIKLEECQKFVDSIIEAREKAKRDRTLFTFEFLHPFNVFKGIFLCMLYSPKNEGDKICVAPFPYRYLNADNLTYNYEDKSRVFVCTSDMKNLILCGFKIKLLFSEYNFLFLRNEQIFNVILKPLDELKVIAKKDNNNSLKKLMKLFMNSLSGKLGQHVQHRIRNSVESTTMQENEQDNSFTSLHYLACFVTAEARYVLFRTIYKLHEEHIYSDASLSTKAGIFLLCDTDSIMYDKHLIASSSVVFKQENEMGYWSNELNDYVVHWGEKKYPNIGSVFILGRKSYVTVDKNKQIISRTLKGIRRDQMQLISYDDLKMVCASFPKVLNFNMLSKQANVNTIGDRLLTKVYFETTVKKSLSMSKPDHVIEHIENEYLLKNNSHNLEKKLYKENINNFLVFVYAK